MIAARSFVAALPAHGSPEDRGSMDAYYRRPWSPHKRTPEGRDIPLTDPDEIAAYTRGYDNEDDRKDWR